MRVLRLTSGRRAFLLGPIGLPPRDLTLKVEALDGTRVLASATVEHVFGLPAAAAAVAPPQTIDGAVQHAVAGLPARTGVASAAWVRDLASGRTAAYNAGAHFPAASTVKLGILLGVLARDSADPLRSSSWSLERALVLDSSNRAANELLPRAGGAAAVDTLIGALGATGTFTCCGYLLEPNERRHVTERARSPAAPADDGRRPAHLPLLQVHDRARSRHAAGVADAGLDRHTAPHSGSASPRARRGSRCGCWCTRAIPGSFDRHRRSPWATRPAGCPTSSTTRRSCSRRTARSSPCS